MTLPDPHQPIDLLTAVEPLGPGRLRAVLPPDWMQGRGLFGGIIAATLVRALEQSCPDRGLRNLAMEIPVPVSPGEVTLELEVLREGNAVNTTAVRLIQDGELRAHAVGILGRTRMSDRDGLDMTPPAPRPWREVEVVPVQAPLAPEFTQFFEYRLTGPFPFTATEPVVEGWVKPKIAGTQRDVAYLAACIDSYWPAHLSREAGYRPMATASFNFQPRPHFEGLDPEAPFFYRARVLGTDGGYSIEFREIWGEDGRLLALNQQTFVIIK